jgi:hypothetical protein
MLYKMAKPLGNKYEMWKIDSTNTSARQKINRLRDKVNRRNAKKMIKEYNWD